MAGPSGCRSSELDEDFSMCSPAAFVPYDGKEVRVDRLGNPPPDHFTVINTDVYRTREGWQAAAPQPRANPAALPPSPPVPTRAAWVTIQLQTTGGSVISIDGCFESDAAEACVRELLKHQLEADSYRTIRERLAEIKG